MTSLFLTMDEVKHFDENKKISIVRDFLVNNLSYEDIEQKHNVHRDIVMQWLNIYGHLVNTNSSNMPFNVFTDRASVYYDKDGNIKNQWVKYKYTDEQKQILLERAIEAMQKKIVAKEPIKFKNQKSLLKNKDLLSTYIITDYHFGQMSSLLELGEEWNVDIAKQTLLNWFKTAIEETPATEHAVFCELGDFLHFDSVKPVTPASGHLLDTSERYSPLYGIVMEVIIEIIDMLLQKHKYVHVLLAEGNHDESTSMVLRRSFDIFYKKEPRVTIETSDIPFYAYSWGDTLLFFHHGHKVKGNQISDVFISMFKDLYGQSKYCYAHTGHYHHLKANETRTMIIEQHQTLCAKDAYSAKHGYNSQRGAVVIMYSKKYGEVGRYTFRPEMVL